VNDLPQPFADELKGIANVTGLQLGICFTLYYSVVFQFCYL